MRILSWNCGGAFRKKSECINLLDWDIAIIQECESPDEIPRDFLRIKEFWIGDNTHKGLCVFSRINDVGVDDRFESKSDAFCEYGDTCHDLKYFLPIMAHGHTIIATWCHVGDDYVFRYVGQLWKYILLNRTLLSADTLFVGDFNANKKWDYKHSWFCFSTVNRMLNQLGLYSFYHQATGEALGAESEKTFYLHRQMNKGYHIDYAYGGLANFLSFSILPIPRINGKFLSDHAPIICEIKSSGAHKFIRQ